MHNNWRLFNDKLSCTYWKSHKFKNFHMTFLKSLSIQLLWMHIWCNEQVSTSWELKHIHKALWRYKNKTKTRKTDFIHITTAVTTVPMSVRLRHPSDVCACVPGFTFVGCVDNKRTSNHWRKPYLFKTKNKWYNTKILFIYFIYICRQLQVACTSDFKCWHSPLYSFYNIKMTIFAKPLSKPFQKYTTIQKNPYCPLIYSHLNINVL